jgi:regulator of protease activity HflC (stomatin/prohibitin superfamily)
VTHQASPVYAPGLADAGAQVAQLHQVLALVGEMAGRTPAGPEAEALEAAARVSDAYEAALPLDQRRFDRLARETMAGATAGVEALLALQQRGRPFGPAACVLADALEQALSRLAETVYA